MQAAVRWNPKVDFHRQIWVAVMTVATTPASRLRRSDAAAMKTLAKQAGEAAQLLKLLGNEKRLLILCFLAVRGEMTVGEMLEVVKLSPSALSQHLARLRADGLVVFRRTSQTLHYRVADPRALRVLQVLKDIYCGDVK
jgi:DNA-binding transcriptional ArsR family regulator